VGGGGVAFAQSAPYLCDLTQTEVESILTKYGSSDTDGYVKRGHDAVFSYPEEYVFSTATFAGGLEFSTDSCMQAPWNDPDCY